jgi:predicted ATP-dependent Lon-type protease
MNWNWLSAILRQLPNAIHLVQSIVGDKTNGATKSQMVKDIVAGSGTIAGGVLTGGNAAYASAASQITQLAIDQIVAIKKADGTYQKATAIATAAQQDVNVAAAVTALVQSVQNPTPAPVPAP